MNRYSFEMQVKGTARCTVDAENIEDAVSKLEEGDWVADDESQETEWFIPRNQCPRKSLLDTEYIK